MKSSFSDKSQDGYATVDRHSGEMQVIAGLRRSPLNEMQQRAELFFGRRAMLRLRRLFAGWRERIRERRRLRGLATLDDQLLRDIGFTRSELLCEAAKPFWRAGRTQTKQSGDEMSGPTTASSRQLYSGSPAILNPLTKRSRRSGIFSGGTSAQRATEKSG